MYMIKTYTGSVILAAGIGAVIFQLFNAGTGIFLGMSVALIALILVSTFGMLIRPNPLSTALFGISYGAFAYFMIANKMTGSMSTLLIPMLLCSLGMYLILGSRD